MQIGDRLRFYRKRQKKTLAEVGRTINLSISHLSGMERGKVMPSLAACQKLADEYGVTLSLLFSGVEIDTGERVIMGAHDETAKVAADLVSDFHEKHAFTPVRARRVRKLNKD